MLAIGRGLMAEPKLLILDEPSLGLSPLLVEELFRLIATIAQQGLAVMLVEQNVVQSLELAGRAYVLVNGLVALSGAAKRPRARSRTRKILSGDVRMATLSHGVVPASVLVTGKTPRWLKEWGRFAARLSLADVSPRRLPGAAGHAGLSRCHSRRA